MSGDPPILQVRGSALFRAPDTLLLFQQKTARLLQALRTIHPIFRRFAIVGKAELLPVDETSSDLDEKILDAISGRYANDLIGDVTNNRASPTALNRLGFSVKLLSTSIPEAMPDVSGSRDCLELSVQGNSAGAESNGGVALSLPAIAGRGMFFWDDLRRIVDAIASIWDLTVVGVRSTDFEAAIKEKGDVYSGQWMTYYRMPELGSCLPSELVWSRLGEGVLIESGRHFPDPTNPSDVAAGKRVREALDALGLVWHSTYAIHGWPPDEEEWRYEAFISGAPRGRKYRVSCIDFDGYDAQRNVLLYAKLFRRLRQQRKEWGLRGWDGPVLNEARRQVRAANGTQIEWHVGLEEPAARVRTLLADYTDFSEEQLRVIYTPVSQVPRRE